MSGQHSEPGWAVEGAIEVARAVPGLSPRCLGRVVALAIDFHLPGTTKLSLQIEYHIIPDTSGTITLIFDGVRGLTLPVLGTTEFELTELEVRNITDRQLEGLCLEVTDHGPDRFTLYCQRAWIDSVLSSSPEGVMMPIWMRDAAM